MDVGNIGLIWLLAAAILAGAELALPGVFSIFLAVAAAITGGLVLLFPDLPLAAQLLGFAAWSVIAVVLGRRYYRDVPVASADPLLNDRVARLVGQTVTVTHAIVAGEGRVRVGDSEWLATGPDLAAGTPAEVIGARDGRLLVSPLPPPSGTP